MYVCVCVCLCVCDVNACSPSSCNMSPRCSEEELEEEKFAKELDLERSVHAYVRA
jgi:hypothetical protein